LEVGAGIGGTTVALHDGAAHSWTCIEPDKHQATRIRAAATERRETAPPHVLVGSLNALAQRPRFDCILYIDVLEHIEDDRTEIKTASRLLKPGGYLVVLSPAHQWLFSEFDRQIGHFRRYTKAQLRTLTPPELCTQDLRYLDSLGWLLSLGNVLFLRKGMPSRWQISFWDRLCVPCSGWLDWLLGRWIGRSVLAVWRKPASGPH
jgi:SAM-dependent methyltransferase